MCASYFQVYDNPSDVIKSLCASIGYASKLIAEADSHRSKPFNYLASVILPAIRHQQIKFFFSDDGRPVGYIVWAYIEKDVEDRLVTYDLPVLHESEWNEGDALWIMDFLVLPGYMNYAVKNIKDSLFSSARKVRYFRLKRGALHIRERLRT
jgi:cytolysin-activating lysine-acyltransferase